MAINCLLDKYVNKFLEGLKDGEIVPEKLADMTTEQRREFLSSYVGKENAKWVNTQFESKLLLKNQKQGMITWAKNIAGLKEKSRNDLIAKIEKLDRALNPAEQDQFLGDIVEKRLGVQIDADEAKTIVDLTTKMKPLYTGRFTDPNKEYFRLKKELVDFMRDRTPEKIPTTPTGQAGQIAADVLSVMRSVKTGFDLSASLRQGFSYFGTKQWLGAFQRMFSYAKSKVNLDELEVNMMSNKYSEEAFSVKRDLGLTMLGETFTQREEAFASKLVDKVPLLKGSARAYEGFLNDLRFNRFVDILEKLDKNGNGITDNPTAMKDLAKVIAAATGRGSLGSAEGAARPLATVLFSPRWLTSRIQILTNPLTKKGVARQEAATALARAAGLSVALIGLVKMAGGDVGDDPRSSDFGKVKIGDTRFDLTGGMGPYIVLATRLAKGETVSSTTGKVTKLNSGDFNEKTRLSLLGDFLEQKTSPFASVIRDTLKGETFDGNPINLEQPPKELLKYYADALITPMLASDAVDAFKEAADNKLVMGTAAGLASIFGVGVSSYEYKPSGKKWDDLKAQVGEEKYTSAVDKFNSKFKESLDRLNDNEKFKSAENDTKNKMIDKLKDDITKSTLKEFGYKKPKRQRNSEDLEIRSAVKDAAKNNK